MTRTLRTRTDERLARPGVVGLVVVGLLGVASALLALRVGTGAAEVAATAALAGVVGVVLFRVPRGWLGPLWLLTTIAGIVAARAVDRTLVLPWVGFLLLGQAVGLLLRHRRQEQRRARAGLPPTGGSGTGPGRAAALRLVRDDGVDQVETIDPPLAYVRESLLGLDGRTRTALSVLRGGARLDVGGDATGALVAYQCDDVTARGLPEWYVVSSADDPGSDLEVDVRLVGVDAHLPASGVTTLGPARAALDAFLVTGGRAAGLPWRTGPDVGDLRAIFDALV